MKSPRSTADAVTRSTRETLSPAQFATEFQRFYERLWLLAAAMLGDRHLAEDIVQDAGIVALKQLDQFEPGTSFIAWISQIVRFQAFNRSRKRTRRRTQSVDPVSLDGEASSQPTSDQLPDPANLLPSEQSYFDDEVMQALNDLREDARACLLLRTIHQLSYSDIAAMLDIAEGTAMSHVHRSKAVLRKRLAPQTKETDTTT